MFILAFATCDLGLFGAFWAFAKIFCCNILFTGSQVCRGIYGIVQCGFKSVIPWTVFLKHELLLMGYMLLMLSDVEKLKWWCYCLTVLYAYAWWLAMFKWIVELHLLCVALMALRRYWDHYSLCSSVYSPAGWARGRRTETCNLWLCHSVTCLYLAVLYISVGCYGNLHGRYSRPNLILLWSFP